jgi:hypothetical protein
VGRLFAWVPGIVRTAIGTALVGMLVGYLLASSVSYVITERGWFANSGEPPEARAYMLAFLQRESEHIAALRPQQDVVSKALSEQMTQTSTGQVKALSLTYLGGSNQGPISVQVYAVEARATDGSQGLITYALTLVGGKVVLVR